MRKRLPTSMCMVSMDTTIDGLMRRALPSNICPVALPKIVQLAGSGGVDIPSPSKLLYSNTPRQFVFT